MWLGVKWGMQVRKVMMMVVCGIVRGRVSCNWEKVLWSMVGSVVGNGRRKGVVHSRLMCMRRCVWWTVSSGAVGHQGVVVIIIVKVVKARVGVVTATCGICTVVAGVGMVKRALASSFVGFKHQFVTCMVMHSSSMNMVQVFL